MFAVWLALGFGIGGMLGLLGGGGSILTVPILVYVVGQTPQAAVTTSLAIVGANSAIGALLHRTHGTLNWRVALLFGGAGMLVSYPAAGISKMVPAEALMVAFSVLMLVVGILLLTRRSDVGQETVDVSLPKVFLGGAGVGLLTGFLGVGGGFLIVPALVMLIGLPMRQAVGTSLLVIAMNSAAGFLGHMGDAAIDLNLVLIFVAAGLGGTMAGSRLAQRVNPATLRRGFALFVIALALVLLADNLPKLIMHFIA